MTIIRSKPKKNFTIFSNELLHNSDLSWGARGLLCFLLSLPENWNFSKEWLYSQSPQGQVATNSLLKELKEKGFVIWEKVNDPVNGMFESYVDIFDIPIDSNKDYHSHVFHDGSQLDGPPYINKELNKKEKEKEKKEKDTGSKAPSSLDASRLSSLLLSKIQENNPKFKKSQAELDSWAQEIDKLNRIDERSCEEIEQMIVFATSNDFWKTNILSAGKLRKQHHTLWMQMHKEKPKIQQVSEEETRWKENHSFAELYQNIAKMHEFKFQVFKDCVRMKINDQSVELRYSEYGFQDQLKNNLRKAGVSV